MLALVLPSLFRKGAHKRYHKLCWLWCYPNLFRNRDTERLVGGLELFISLNFSLPDKNACCLLCSAKALIRDTVVFYGSWKCSSTVLISEGDAVSDGVRTRHKGWIMINGRG
ncbi:uncharacterized protein [Oryza sativa Japonica Group]|uniref:uncharacterized protein isoform X2 n=1 Tax=Oryza sativa subsp. japonica TaxID=39947 RepID=UPI00339CBFC9